MSETKSSDSGEIRSNTSEEYEIVSEGVQTPKLDVADGTDIKQTIDECLDSGKNSREQSPAEAKPTTLSNENVEDEPDDGDHTVFHNIIYLGGKVITGPKDEDNIQEFIVSMQKENNGQEVTLSVPRTSAGLVLLKKTADGKTHSERFPIQRILFFARGLAESPDSACFAFTFAAGNFNVKPIYECHVFRCQVPEAVTKVFVSFAQAFKKGDPSATASQTCDEGDNPEDFVFDVCLEIREDDGKQSFGVVPRQKGVFSLRCNIEKKVVISLQQISRQNSCHLNVERCFGMLVSPGRNVRHADMQLLEHVTMATSSSDEGTFSYVITGVWDPRETAFAVLNQETPAEVQSVFITIAADLVIAQIAEPVRFVIETRARILPQAEKYWYFTKRNLTKHFQLRLKPKPESNGQKLFDLVSVISSEEVDTSSRFSFTKQLASLTYTTLTGSIRGPMASQPEPHSPREDSEDDNDDEPLLSGFGEVSKDCPGEELELWRQVLSEWEKNPMTEPKQLPLLVKRGIPEALRGEVWQRLTGANIELQETVRTYQILITKESPDEKVILRDIHRTFPAHEFFKDSGGTGQEALYKISKAYSVYDSEIGYCQGQSFLIAALLLQMPEEQAFGVLVKVMHRHGLRDMFRENFEQLQLRLYQLDRLIQTNHPDLWNHFVDIGLESHMYASQWFLTLFTAKFPLFLVFRVLDCFLLLGFDSIFQVSLGILKVSKKDMLQQDFEGLMKYFRVTIPKRYRSEENAKYLMEVAMNIKLKKLKKFEKEWIAIKEEERRKEDPVVRYERENKKLLTDNMRLDTENDNLARQLVNSKIEMMQQIDTIEDEKDHYEKELGATRALLDEVTDEKKRLEGETEQLKSLLKRETEKLDAEIATKNNVIAEYKTICSQLSEKLEKVKAAAKASGDPPDQAPLDNEEGAATDLDKANVRIRELELELAQTKLALVETECKNQDLTHQFSAVMQDAAAASAKSNTWFTKTLSSIKETSMATKNYARDLKKSTSVDFNVSKRDAGDRDSI